MLCFGSIPKQRLIVIPVAKKTGGDDCILWARPWVYLQDHSMDLVHGAMYKQQVFVIAHTASRPAS